MLIHGVDVIGVVQHHAQEPAELGDEGAQNPGAVHFHQGLVHGFLPLQNAEKRRVGGRRAAKLVVDQIEVLPQ